MLSESSIHIAGRVDQIVRDYFFSNPIVMGVFAKDLMPLFVEKGVFNKDYSQPGLPIRNLLRVLDKEDKLTLLKHCRVVRNDVNGKWYFTSQK